jgi:integrase
MPPDLSAPQADLDLKSFRETTEAFLAHLRLSGRSQSTIRLYGRVLDLYFEAGLERTLGEEISPATRQLRFSVLRSFFRWAVASGRLPVNPIEGLPPPRHHLGEPRALSQEELAKVRQVVADLALPHRALLTLLVETGLRQAEAVGLRVRDVDLSTAGHEGIVVHGKGGRERFVPLPAGFESRRLLRRLVAGKAQDAFLFSKDGDRPWATSTVRKLWGRVCRKAGIADRGVHALRHTAATRMIEQVGDLVLVQRLLGHASIQTTARYVARGDEALRRAMDRAGGGWSR